MAAAKITEEEHNRPQEFEVYRQRWFILFTAVLLNISCGTLWISYAATATIVATYFDVEPSKINWFASIYFILAMPFTFLSAFLVEKLGLRLMLHICCILNTTAAVIRVIATSAWIDDPHTQYGISLGGQVFAAMANSFILGIGPKISQVWFPESQRGISTSFHAMSRPLGVIVTQLSVPYIIVDPEDVPLNNYIWLGPAVLCQICTLIFITRSAPVTHPSLSSYLKSKSPSAPFWPQMRKMFSNVHYVLIFLSVGGGIGFVFTMGALTEQLLCPLGYSENLAGLVNAMMLIGGFFGATFATIIVKKKPLYSEITKLFLSGGNLFLIILLEFYLFADFDGLLVASSFIFGVFATGALPIGLELGIETTYPVEETLSSSFIFFSGQLMAMVFIILIPVLATEKDDKLSNLSTCGSYITPMNYNLPLLLMMAALTLFTCAFILFFNTEYKRKKAESEHENVTSNGKLNEAINSTQKIDSTSL